MNTRFRPLRRNWKTDKHQTEYLSLQKSGFFGLDVCAVFPECIDPLIARWPFVVLWAASEPIDELPFWSTDGRLCRRNCFHVVLFWSFISAKAVVRWGWLPPRHPLPSSNTAATSSPGTEPFTANVQFHMFGSKANENVTIVTIAVRPVAVSSLGTLIGGPVVHSSWFSVSWKWCCDKTQLEGSKTECLMVTHSDEQR